VVNRYVALYPAAWRARYGEELEAVLGEAGLSLRDRLDLVRGALDAHLHPAVPSPLPVAAAVTGSALAAAHAIALGVQPVPTDWPGYLDDALPLIVGSVAALIPVHIGLWLRLGDSDGVLGRLGIVLAVAGHVAWLAVLLAAVARVTYGPVTAAIATVGLAGTALLGVALVGHGRPLLGGLLAAAGLAGLAPPTLGWPAFAAAWTAVAAVMLVDLARRRSPTGGPRVA
jgi:hypothetical protein